MTEHDWQVWDPVGYWRWRCSACGAYRSEALRSSFDRTPETPRTVCERGFHPVSEDCGEEVARRVLRS